MKVNRTNFYYIELKYIKSYLCSNSKTMAEDLFIQGNSKAEKYETLLPQLQALIVGEADCVANLGNLAAGFEGNFRFFLGRILLGEKR